MCVIKSLNEGDIAGLILETVINPLTPFSLSLSPPRLTLPTCVCVCVRNAFISIKQQSVSRLKRLVRDLNPHHIVISTGLQVTSVGSAWIDR